MRIAVTAIFAIFCLAALAKDGSKLPHDSSMLRKQGWEIMGREIKENYTTITYTRKVGKRVEKLECLLKPGCNDLELELCIDFYSCGMEKARITRANENLISEPKPDPKDQLQELEEDLREKNLRSRESEPEDSEKPRTEPTVDPLEGLPNDGEFSRIFRKLDSEEKK